MIARLYASKITRILTSTLFFTLTIVPAANAQGTPPTPQAAPANGIISAAEAGKILPPSVYFRGQSAPIQARNSGGIRFSPEAVVLVTLVDTSGYSTGVAQKYQAYLITETVLDLPGHRLVPGAYGIGFLPGNTLIVMDIGGHDLFNVTTTADPTLKRPAPLQMLPEPNNLNAYRLYVGRTYLPITQAKP
jgi:hypothetical protein